MGYRQIQIQTRIRELRDELQHLHNRPYASGTEGEADRMQDELEELERELRETELVI